MRWIDRDFVYVLDVVQALLLSMDREIHGVFDVGTGLTILIKTGSLC